MVTVWKNPSESFKLAHLKFWAYWGTIRASHYIFGRSHTITAVTYPWPIDSVMSRRPAIENAVWTLWEQSVKGTRRLFQRWTSKIYRKVHRGQTSSVIAIAQFSEAPLAGASIENCFVEYHHYPKYLHNNNSCTLVLF